MIRHVLFASSAIIGLATPALAQNAAASPQNGASSPAANSSSAESAPQSDDIIVTATRRSQTLSDVPIAISAVTAQTLQNTGATDLRGVNQISPSLLISSSTSEAVGAVARIRGVGTVGDNPGLESSVATFIDGVYRSRSGVALTELGAVDRIEILRGPQGTLFGRNASAGLINVVTQGPSFTESGTAELSYGNYSYWRGGGSLTGPITKSLAYRLDGVYTSRKGFLTDPATGKRYNDRNRYLVRGQLLYEPSSDLSVRLIGDYARRDEQCCAAVYQQTRDVRLVSGNLVSSPSSVAALENALGANIHAANPYDRQVSVTPGRDYRSFVRDWGVSAQVDWDTGIGKLTSITAYRDWTSKRGMDADFNALDLLYRTKYNQSFKTFTQEIRFQGKAFDDHLDWLVGGYFASEKLTLTDNLRFGNDYGRYAACLAVVGSALAPTFNPTQVGCHGPGVPGPTAAALALLDSVRNTGASLDVFTQKDLNYAFFTHNIVKLTDQLSLTLGARYTHDRKTLNANIASDPSACSTLAAIPSAGPIAQLACANNIGPLFDGNYKGRVSDGQWSGTAVLSWKPIHQLLTYASFSRGYKAGGFNLDRAGLSFPSPNANQLTFDPEKVDAFEIGAKYKQRGFSLNLAGFYQRFSNFQLNTFNGINFVVENIEGCGGSLTSAGLCSGKTKAGVISKGVEVEAALRITRTLNLDAGYTYADTHYADQLTGRNGRPLPAPLFMLPGQNLSNDPKNVITAGATWTPTVIPAKDIRALVHADVRYQSSSNTGSDLALEKAQPGYALVNARIGLLGKDDGWSLEFWCQNVFNQNYTQIVGTAPFQPPGGGTVGALLAGRATVANSLFIDFLGEPRTFGATARTKF